MSVSGPRPHMIEHDGEFAKILRNYYSRHHVKPGITGLAQSMGLRGEISGGALLEKRIGHDLIYIREDLKITAKDAKGAKKNMKTSSRLFYNILNNIM
jgi:lipopolysaccharide/colanic/teichoic acid biosynthesis glycosyltransferase